MQEEIKFVLNHLRDQMREWEVECKKRVDKCYLDDDDFDLVCEHLMDEYMDIFKQFCSSVSEPRGFTFSDPPEYEKDAKITSIMLNNDIAVAIVSCILFPDQVSEFTLVLENSCWRVKERNILTSRGTKLLADL